MFFILRCLFKAHSQLRPLKTQVISELLPLRCLGNTQAYWSDLAPSASVLPSVPAGPAGIWKGSSGDTNTKQKRMRSDCSHPHTFSQWCSFHSSELFPLLPIEVKLPNWYKRFFSASLNPRSRLHRVKHNSNLHPSPSILPSKKCSDAHLLNPGYLWHCVLGEYFQTTVNLTSTRNQY